MATGDIKELPLVVIVGPTASGKTALAIELAKRFGGEIICADSRTIYKGMDIGTAKPTTAERQQVPHWGLDLIEPGERYSAAEFKKYAEQKIIDIRTRGHIPFLVGGTGLYVDAVIFNYEFGSVADEAQRARLEQMTLDQLIIYCRNNNITLPENDRNKRYVIRAIEQNGQRASRSTAPVNPCIIVGIATERGNLRGRIERRIEQLLHDGVVEESILLGKKYGWDSQAMTGNIYPLVHQYLNKALSLDELKEKSTTLDWRLAKRQLTWLRRNPYVTWGTIEETKRMLIERLDRV